ncbi:hypothetical protein JKF63_04519 [Porcisia hertigi]|uniref:Uncharacterized protein n=1 Tax=Porcisia hertigi TaxID=2761500 RepID=A0A836HMX5_9TRYP|nr:hypothetical protein JKF63_04519 [Porcisia hertigi]
MNGAPAKRRRFDSDDDEDEYVAVNPNSGLLQYAISAHFPTDEMPAVEDREGEDGVVDTLVSSTATAPAIHAEADKPAEVERTTAAKVAAGQRGAANLLKTPLLFDEDRDVPAEYNGLLSAQLMNVLFVPLAHICEQRSCTDKLLAQYAPSEASNASSNNKSYHNVYGIAPGFRWDGVVRGRGPVD